MSEIMVVKTVSVIVIGFLLLLILCICAWARGYKDGAQETREFYRLMKPQEDKKGGTENE